MHELKGVRPRAALAGKDEGEHPEPVAPVGEFTQDAPTFCRSRR
jgi:hypothetical protein